MSLGFAGMVMQKRLEVRTGPETDRLRIINNGKADVRTISREEEEYDEWRSSAWMNLGQQEEAKDGLEEYDDELEEHFRKPKFEEYEKDMASSENRSESLETLAIVAALLAGFAANDASSFDAFSPHWGHPHREFYAIFLFFSLCGNLFISVVGSLTVMACKRVHSWDVKLMRKTPGKVLRSSDYVGTMTHLFGEDRDNWFKRQSDDGSSSKEDSLILKLPLNYWVFKAMCDGKFTITGFGVTLFPYNVATYLLAIALNFSKGGDVTINVITWSLMTPWILITFYGVRRMVVLFMM